MHQVVIGDRNITVAMDEKTGQLVVDGIVVNADLVKLSDDHYNMIIDGKSLNIEVVERDSASPTVKVEGKNYSPQIKNETDLLLERLGMNISAKKEVKDIKAPMPGLVLEVLVEVGQQVNEGDPIVVLEAMKMENILKSPASSVVKEISVGIGEAIDKNTVLIKFE